MKTILEWYATILPVAGVFDVIIMVGVFGLLLRKFRNLRRFGRDQKGTVAIEAAILMPVMLLIVGFGVDTTIASTAKAELEFATQQAAFATANGMATSAVQSMFAGNVVLKISPTLSCSNGSGTVTCAGTGAYHWSFAGLFGTPDTLPLSYSATAAIQQGTPTQ